MSDPTRLDRAQLDEIADRAANNSLHFAMRDRIDLLAHAAALEAELARLRDFLLAQRDRWESARIKPGQPFVLSNNPDIHNMTVDAHIAEIDEVLNDHAKE